MRNVHIDVCTYCNVQYRSSDGNFDIIQNQRLLSAGDSLSLLEYIISTFWSNQRLQRFYLIKFHTLIYNIIKLIYVKDFVKRNPKTRTAKSGKSTIYERNHHLYSTEK